jgi:hypothetical protein
VTGNVWELIHRNRNKPLTYLHFYWNFPLDSISLPVNKKLGLLIKPSRRLCCSLHDHGRFRLRVTMVHTVCSVWLQHPNAMTFIQMLLIADQVLVWLSSIRHSQWWMQSDAKTKANKWKCHLNYWRRKRKIGCFLQDILCRSSCRTVLSVCTLQWTWDLNVLAF